MSESQLELLRKGISVSIDRTGTLTKAVKPDPEDKEDDEDLAASAEDEEEGDEEKDLKKGACPHCGATSEYWQKNKEKAMD